MLNKTMKIEKDFVELKINPKIYSKEAVFAAGYIFLDKAYILLDQIKNDIMVYLYPQDAKSDLKRLGLDFYNELLNYSHYFSRAKTNTDAIKYIMQRALSSAAPSLLQEAEDREIKQLISELEQEEKGHKNAANSKKGR